MVLFAAKAKFSGPSRRVLAKWALAGAFALFATDAMAIDIATQTDWNTAVAAVAAAGAGSTVAINFTSGFTLTSSLAQLQASNANVTVNITGNSQTISGNSQFQGIEVSGANALTVNISNLAITGTKATGGSGANGQIGFFSNSLSYGSGGGGGGGLGAGGGLFVGSGANVTLSAVTFTGSNATGGAGGNGGSSQNGASSPTGGNGGDGGVVNGGTATVGGGGAGGAGGNSGTQGTAGTAGGTLGAGGGGGGGSGTTNGNYTNNNAGGNGNGNAGHGGLDGDGATNHSGQPGADGGSGGGGGGANGGAIYVATGGTLTILDTPISGSTVTGGAGGTGGQGFGGSAPTHNGAASEDGSTGPVGAGAGAGIFLNGVNANIGVSTGTVTYADTIAGAGATNGGTTTAITKIGNGTLVLSGTNTFTGDVDISAGTLSVAAAANLGSGSKNVVMSTGTTFATTATATFGSTIGFKIAGSSMFDVAGGTAATLQGVIADGASAGTLVKTDTGTLMLSGANIYTGGTIVNAGILQLGQAAALPTTGTTAVAAGATLNLNGFNETFAGLTGAGTVSGGNSTIGAGATFAPGNGTPGSAMSIVGNLAFASGAIYMVQVNPSTASLANVAGTAVLTGASVNATYASGGYVSKQYTILTATGGVSGMFSSLTNSNLPTNFTSSLSYDANDAYINLTLNFVPPPTAPNFGSGLNGNQQSVANTLINFFNTTGSIPMTFSSLSPAGLTQISGEAASDAQTGAFQVMNDFLSLMLDQTGGGGGGAGNGGALGFAPERDMTLPSEIALAYDSILTKAPAKQAFDQRWSTWGSAFGGTSRIDGDPAVGSNNVNVSDFGFAGGMDYRFSPDTFFGFALAGAGTNWSVNQNLGTGRSDTFQGGVYAKTHAGPVYLSAALAAANNWFTTNRTSALGDQLQSRFQGQSVGGRLEAGYRFGLASPNGLAGITPYAAVQAENFRTPTYSETDLAAGGFGLTFNAQNATDTRSELGGRIDDLVLLGEMPLILRGRLAWAHDWISNPALTAAFQTLPGTSFIVNGAALPKDNALATASAELRMTANWSLLGKFDGEYGKGAQTYAGTGTLRYSW